MGPFKLLWLIGKLLALAYIFVGGGMLAIGVLPIVLLWPGCRRGRVQHTIQLTFRFFLTLLQITQLISLRIIGADRIKACSGCILIANHPSLLDVVILMALIPRAQCIVKHELWNSRLVGRLMWHAGYIRNDLPPEALIEACRTSLAQGRVLIIFPEGTRTVPGRRPRFQRGFANIATLTGASIQTVFIRCEPPILYKGEPWWRVPQRKPRYELAVGDMLDGATILGYGQRSIAARKLVKSLEEYYAERLRNPRSGT